MLYHATLFQILCPRNKWSFLDCNWFTESYRFTGAMSADLHGAYLWRRLTAATWLGEDLGVGWSSYPTRHWPPCFYCRDTSRFAVMRSATPASPIWSFRPEHFTWPSFNCWTRKRVPGYEHCSCSCLLLAVVLLLSDFRSTKTFFPFHNRSSLNFAYRMVTIFSIIWIISSLIIL